MKNKKITKIARWLLITQVVCMAIAISIVTYLIVRDGGISTVREYPEHQKNNEVEKDVTNEIKLHNNKECGFEFEYPSNIAPIHFSEDSKTGCQTMLVFYESGIVTDALEKDPPEKKPDAKVQLSVCIADKQSNAETIGDFIDSRYYNELKPDFKETKAGEFEAMELNDRPQNGNILVVDSPQCFVELGNRDNPEILDEVKQTFNSL